MMLAERLGSRPATPQHDGHDGAVAGHEQFRLRGAEAVHRVRTLFRGGNVLRIRIKDANGEALIEIPSLLGIRRGGRVLRIMAAVRALASLSGELMIEVEREAAWPLYEG
jgi:hypothetical protein